MYKLVAIARKDINVPHGKMIAQCGHAYIGSYEVALARAPEIVRKWKEEAMYKKIALKVDSLQELIAIRDACNAAGIPNSGLIVDAGLTCCPAGTITALGIGPAKSEDIDKIVRSLRLY